MKTDCFDAAVDFSSPGKDKPLNVKLLVGNKAVHASLCFYPRTDKKDDRIFLARASLQQPLFLRWRDSFQVKEGRKRNLLGKGVVLSPFSEKLTPKKTRKRAAFLLRLLGERKEALEALAGRKGTQGLRESEMGDFFGETGKPLLRLAQELEEEGRVRILSFSPLFLVSRESLDFLCQKIRDFLALYHQKLPDHPGPAPERIGRRFNLHPTILALAISLLQRSGQAKEFGGRIALSEFRITLTGEEKKILRELDEMCLRGEMRLFSLDELRSRFRLSSKNLDRLLSLLIERRKVVQGKEGLLLHSGWLDEVIRSLRAGGRKELTVQEFKKLTGLSRKYAIPLLELLDQMGVTRRKGSVREVL